jgi:ferric-dicitrate binding protein FerR (iron transport regulator)
MNFHSPAIASFLLTLSLFGAQAVHAGTPAGHVTQLNGFVMAVKANGALKVLSPQSVIEAGDTLVSEQDTYVRIGLADGRQAVLGPQTRLKFTSTTSLNLATGQLQVVAAAQPGARRLTIEAGETTVDAGTAGFNLFYRPDPAADLAQRAYARASLASATSPMQSDAGSALPIWETVAQLTPPLCRWGREATPSRQDCMCM